MQILMFYPQGCAIASPWALLCRAVGAGFQLTEASRNKQCFQFRLSLFSIFLRVLSQTVDEPFFVQVKAHFCFLQSALLPGVRLRFQLSPANIYSKKRCLLLDILLFNDKLFRNKEFTEFEIQ